MAKIACLLHNDFEDSEFRIPHERLAEAGHEIVIVGLKAGEEVEGKRGRESVRVETTARSLDPAGFDGLLIPGGWSPDKLRMDADLVAFVRAMVTAGKPTAAICHGPWLLAEADVVRGRTLTSYPSIKTDMRNAGANWVDQDVMVDGNLVTSRKPDDLDAFCNAFLSKLAPVPARRG
ncbi:MAG: type 1 glutamine amidotransferase [Planctomycetota bacterium]|nr:MAG: type 1 glutamine amidotransferase [Planctomycetota bacterium]